jgi:hypothetical protein
MGLKDPEARRAYHREYMRRRHAADPDARQKQLERVRRNDARYKTEKRAWVDGYLADHPCVDCGESDREVLDFDHVFGEKSANVSQLVRGRFPLSRVIAEVALCEVRCANCHRRVTRRRERELLGKLVAGSGFEPETSGI